MKPKNNNYKNINQDIQINFGSYFYAQKASVSTLQELGAQILIFLIYSDLLQPLLLQYFFCFQSMRDSSNQQRVKRSSKISQALRMKFLNALVQDGQTIKKTAQRFKINYSTAKIIVKENSKFIQEKRIECMDKSHSADEQQRPLKKNDSNDKIRCCIKEVTIDDTKCGSQNTNTSYTSQIKVISTVAWDFLNCEYPHIT